MVSQTKTLVMTGGTRGIGRRAIEMLLEQPGWRVLLLARPSPEATDMAGYGNRLAIIPADLADLRSVKEACAHVRSRLAGAPIDGMAFNAGIQALLGDQVSKDGFEISFAVNHLAHVLIADELAPSVGKGGRIVITASEVHDPEAFCLLGISRATWQDPLEFADVRRSQVHVPGRVDLGESRYSVSKLCNVMHARALAEEHPGIETVSFNPSVVPGTGIARDRNALQRYLWRTLMPFLAPVLPGVRHVETSGADLAWLIADADLRQRSGSYFDGRIACDGSPESRDPAKIARLMEASRALIVEAFEPAAA
jgi:NAD(P)-dependent dehydrogenase (short-subunit alcohol dehydrogenase family)